MAIRRPKIAVIDEAKPKARPKARKAKAKKPEKAAGVLPNMPAEDAITLLSTAVGYALTNDQVKMLAEQIETGSIDTNRPITFYLTEACAPTGKDQQRIYDIIKKSQDGDGIVSICKADFSKMERLAQNMNNAIKDEAKRKARKEACDFYGLTFLAECFSPKYQIDPKDAMKPLDNRIDFGMDFGDQGGMEEFPDGLKKLKYKQYEDFIDLIDNDILNDIIYKPHNYVIKEDDDFIDKMIKDM